jgi:hypothetical protein
MGEVKMPIKFFDENPKRKHHMDTLAEMEGNVETWTVLI